MTAVGSSRCARFNQPPLARRWLTLATLRARSARECTLDQGCGYGRCRVRDAWHGVYRASTGRVRRGAKVDYAQ